MEIKMHAQPLLRDAPHKERTIIVLVLTGIAALGPLLFGFSIGFTSPVQTQITDQLHLTPAESSLFSSLVTIGAMVGSLMGGPLSNAIGRNRAIGIGALPLGIGYVIMGFAQSVAVLDVGRILTGIGVGIESVCVPVFIAEVAPQRLRGALGATNQFAITIGILVEFGIGVAVPWRWLAYIDAIVAGALFALHFFLPHTPRWLVTKHRLEDAKKALRLLRGPHADIDVELEELERAAQQSTEAVKLSEVVAPSMRMPLFVGVTMMFFQQFSGVNAVVFYVNAIFVAAGSPPEDANRNMVIFSAVQVAATFVSVLLVDRLGRKPLLIIALGGMTIACVMMGVFFNIRDHQHEELGPLALAALLLYIAAFSIGVGAIPWLIMSEIFPTRVRGTAASIATMSNWLFAFIVTETFSSMLTSMQPEGTFFFYGGICLVGIAFVLLAVPETKGKTLEEITEGFAGSRRPLN